MQRSLRRMESASLEEITRYQERRLRAMVKVAAARSPFYRDWFASSGTSASSIRTLDDLAALPLLKRDDLVERPDRFRVYPRRLMWAAHSSGTSGTVVTAYRTPGSSVFELSALERQWSWFGLPPRPRRITLRAAGPNPSRDGAVSQVIAGSQQMVVSAYTLGTSTLRRLLAEMRDFGPHAIEGWPSSITLLASLLHDRGERLPVAGVITSSEVITAQQIALMEEVFCAPVIDHYGQTERVTMAGQCQAGGYHLFPDYAITELLPVEGRPGRWEIVGTPLHNWGFPLLRYRTGDQVGQAPDGRCPCGRAFPLIGPIDGRLEDSFTSSTGRVLPMPSIILSDLVGVREAQIAQLAPGRYEVRMVPAPRSDPAALKAKVLGNVERYFGTGQTVTFRVLDHIPRSNSGKLKQAVVEHQD